MTGLVLSPNLTLPLDWMVMATVAYGARGSGKTTLGRVVAEELWRQGQRFVAIDLKGDWYGLKATADGAGPAIPVVIFGGEHADLPLVDGSGALVGEIVAQHDQPFIVDLERMSKGRQVRWLKDFFLSLYDHNRRPLLVIADEIQRYAPQRPMSPDETICLGAVEDVIKLGRKHGLGILALTQRGAGLNKEVSELCDVLVALRTPGPLDQDRIKDWLDANTTRAQRDQVMGQIAKLPTGTAIVASGHPDIDLFATVAIRRSETFDSSATPKVGQAIVTPRVLADVDQAAIRERLEASVQVQHTSAGGAGAPASTRDQARALAEQRKLIEEKDAYILTLETEVRALRARPAFDTERFTHDVLSMESAAMRVIDAAGELKAEMVRARPAPALPPNLNRDVEFSEASNQPRSVKQSRRAMPATVTLTAPQQRIVDALASLDALGLYDVARANLAVFSDASPKSSAFGTNLSTLADAGLVVYPSSGMVAITNAGRALAASPRAIGGLAELHDAWRSKLPASQWRILAVLIEGYPAPWHRERLADRAGQSPKSSAYGTNLSDLKSLGLITYPAPGQVAASALLFP